VKANRVIPRSSRPQPPAKTPAAAPETSGSSASAETSAPAPAAPAPAAPAAAPAPAAPAAGAPAPPPAGPAAGETRATSAAGETRATTATGETRATTADAGAARPQTRASSVGDVSVVPDRLPPLRTGKIVVEDIRPRTPHGFPAKAVVGETVPVRATIFRDGHDILAARASLRSAAGELLAQAPLEALGNDEWGGTLTPSAIGAHQIVVEAWTDRHATWAHKAAIKLGARQDVDVEIAEGLMLLREGLAGAHSAQRPVLEAALQALENEEADQASRLNPALVPAVGRALDGAALAWDLTAGVAAPLWVDRERALVGAWYEIFPRSFGGLRGAAAEVPRIASLGFDVLYVPPVHPIGLSFRKGRNNTLEAGPDDPGSPWGIGAAEGGHLALHPDLGTFEDFELLVNTLAQHGMELALDYALNCSPDHPWVAEHPEWFHHRPDGSIAYSENPPKKYQDIYPINFWPEEEEDRAALWWACKEIFDFWIDKGVHIFRVDNPHTKALAFWEWVIPVVQREHPEVLFLAEAFTRPKVMAKLAEIGFSQSYTYFTWRTTQYGDEGLRTYLEELAHGPLADYMRPNFWPNTPDILSGPLRDGPPAAFALRLVLAATMTPSYGVYSGYELYENVPMSPTNEEYFQSEKYEIKHRDYSRGGTLQPLMASLNQIRRRHPALARLRPIRFHASTNPEIIAYSKASDDGQDVVLVVVTLDPRNPQSATLSLDLEALGLPATGGAYTVYDELSGESYTWSGADPFVVLEPWRRVAHVFDVRRRG
jgi:starch synthase (maltosyl-transferring)